MTVKGSTKIVNFKTPVAEVLVLGRGDQSYSEMHYFVENILLNSQAQIRQSEDIVIMTNEWST